MARFCGFVFVLALAGCSSFTLPQRQVQQEVSPCAFGEATYACQVKRYHDTL